MTKDAHPRLMEENADWKCKVCGEVGFIDDGDFCSKCDFRTCIGCCMRPFSHQNTANVNFSDYEDLSDGAKSVLDYLDNILVYASIGDGQNEKEFIRQNLNQLLELIEEPMSIDLKLPTLEEQKRIVSEIEELNSEQNEIISKLMQHFQDENEET